MIKKFTIIFLLFLSYCHSNFKYELSICTIFRDEAPYLKEWIEFHRLLGVEHFYLCNHNSTDEFMDVLKPYIKKGIVELENNYEGENSNQSSFCYGIQPQWYNKCLEKSKGVSKWVAFIDSDEFILPTEKSSIPELLKDYDDYGSVSIHWLLFGTSFIDKLSEDQLMIEQLTSCAKVEFPGHCFVKTITKPECAKCYTDPHFVYLNPGFNAIGIEYDKMKINHYWTRDEYYFWTIKVARQIQLYGQADHAIHQYNAFNQSQDFLIQKFAGKLRKRMKNN